MMSIVFGSRFILAMTVGFALCTVPAVAEDNKSPSQVEPAAGLPLSQALAALATADGFEVRGLDRVGDETVQPPKSVSAVKAVRRLLDGYAYTLELAPADATGKSSGKLVRVSILGHAGAADAGAAPSDGAPGPNVADGQTGADQNGAAGGPDHPVSQMLQSIARGAIPPMIGAVPGGRGQAAMPQAYPGMIASAGGGANSSGGTAASAATGVAAGAAPSAAASAQPNSADMAAMTKAASANLQALVQSLKAACPAGGKC